MPIYRKRSLLIILSVLLVAGFTLTSLVSYFVSRKALRNEIAFNALPLTSDNIYSEIQRDLLGPILISSLMANDTFLRDWVLRGEENPGEIIRYLREITEKYDVFTSFFVSDRTFTYYQTEGILKQVHPDEQRDIWYFRVREMEPEYEINVDPDMANEDTMTVFINHRVQDYDGNFIGATGVGLSTFIVMDLIEYYREKYNRTIYFVDSDGNIVLRSGQEFAPGGNIRDTAELGSLADRILSEKFYSGHYNRNGSMIHLNARFIPELQWHLILEQTEERTMAQVFHTLLLNLLFCGIITLGVLVITTYVIGSYQHAVDEQQRRITRQHNDLLVSNQELADAMAQVKTLSGLMPICANCKNVRDDNGYWQQIESYLKQHSDAEFSHSLCPDCVKKLYPDIKL